MKKMLLLLTFIFCCLTFKLNVALAQEDYFYNQSSYLIVYDPGTYIVGENIPVGEYRIISNGSYGMFVRSNDANQQDIVEVSPVTTHSYIEVLEGEYLQLNGVFAVPVEDVDPIVIKNNTIEDGKFLVGHDIPSGEYEVIQRDDEYAMVAVYDSLSPDDIANVSIIENNTYVDLKDGQYLDIKGSYIKDDRIVSQRSTTATPFGNWGGEKSDASIKKEPFEKGELLEYMESEDGYEYDDEKLREVMSNYNMNVLNAKFFKDIGVFEYDHEKEMFQLTFTEDIYKATLNAYIVDLDINTETWDMMVEVFEKISMTIATDMGTNYTFGIVRPNNEDLVLVYQNGEPIKSEVPNIVINTGGA